MNSSKYVQRSLLGMLAALTTIWFAAHTAHAVDSNAAPTSANSTGTVGEEKSTSGYVGSDTCKTCHEDIYNAWAKTPHWKTTLNKEPSHQGCEGCHGPGAAHVAGGGVITKIFTFKDMSRQETSARCLTCHGEAHAQSHFVESAHSSNDVGCLDCHSPHHAKESQFLLVQSQPQLCYGCHTSAKADFAKPFHHRVNEGLVECSDCHNPHGTATVQAVAEPAQRRCRLLQVPRRQARTLCLRACASKDRGLHQLPHPSRFHQSPTAQGEPGEHAVPAVPYLPDDRSVGARAQSVGEVSGLHHVSQPDSRLQLQRGVLQVRE